MPFHFIQLTLFLKPYLHEISWQHSVVNLWWVHYRHGVLYSQLLFDYYYCWNPFWNSDNEIRYACTMALWQRNKAKCTVIRMPLYSYEYYLDLCGRNPDLTYSSDFWYALLYYHNRNPLSECSILNWQELLLLPLEGILFRSESTRLRVHGTTCTSLNTVDSIIFLENNLLFLSLVSVVRFLPN